MAAQPPPEVMPALSATEESKTMEPEGMTYAEVAKHSTKDDLYLVIHDQVYNASLFVDEHPSVPTFSPPYAYVPTPRLIPTLRIILRWTIEKE